MNALTSRQTQILKALIDEYIETAEPVGSDALDKKYNLGVSPATIRNEMVNLTKLGFLKQPHTSAGRVPTSGAMKFYIDQLMEEKQILSLGMNSNAINHPKRWLFTILKFKIQFKKSHWNYLSTDVLSVKETMKGRFIHFIISLPSLMVLNLTYLI